MKRLLGILIVLSLIPVCSAPAAEKEGVELTVYNQDFGLVKDKRFLEIKKGVSNFRFDDVAASIEATSLRFKNLSDPAGCLILEQNYEYDLVSADKLLSKYLGNTVHLLSGEGKTYDGTLLSYDQDNVVLRTSAGISLISRSDNIREISFPELPQGLISKPALSWILSSNREGKQLVEVSYLARNINWLADYIAVINRDDTAIDLSGWVSIDNRSGADYRDAVLKLIAGDVNRAAEERPAVMYDAVQMKVASGAQFEEKAFFEYHIYSLPRPVTVRQNQTKQISLLSAGDIPVKKTFIFENGGQPYPGAAEGERKISVMLELRNNKESKLGIPLPKGRIKAYKQDADSSLQFVGEDSLGHTPEDEAVKIKLGDAFDAVGERKVINSRQGENWSEESIEISLRNHKEKNIEVRVIEHLERAANWKITQNSHSFSKKDAGSVEFNISVPGKGETKLNYTVKYWW
ncbi:MAG: DUF4139 domain-containing protein [Candidatus Omnitrophota bacterium]|jgi:hypothetical protein